MECAKRAWQSVKGWMSRGIDRIRQSKTIHYLRPPRHVQFMLWVFVAGMVAFTAIRTTLLLRNMEFLQSGVDVSNSEIIYSLFTGARFDIALMWYLLLPAMLLLATLNIVRRKGKIFSIIAEILLAIGISLSLMTAIGDIPFFEYTGTHVDAVGIRYAVDDTAQATDVIAGNVEYSIFASIAIFISVVFIVGIVRLGRRLRIAEPATRYKHTVIYILLLITLLPFAQRGCSFQSAPMSARDAVISNNNFLNQVAIQPVMTFVESLIKMNSRNIELMDSSKARSYVVAEYLRDDSFVEHVEAKESPWRNVVFIIQEGNCAVNLAHEGSTKGLLPHLDRLITEGLYFENTFSTSTHTSYGIYSTITSMPPYMHLHPLEDGYRQNLNTVFNQVQTSGRMSTHFFITHEPKFDNVGGFVVLQGFGNFVSRDDYGHKVDKVWGVDDHIMFDAVIDKLDKDYTAGKPFAAVCLTCSNHKPYDPPAVEGFRPTAHDSEGHAIQYADWAMNRFLEMCSEREWFDETLFVITADHGHAITNDYAVSESCFHIPLLFYSPAHIEPEVRNNLVSQMDIVPTAMSMLGIEFDNYTFGIDITKCTRRMIPSTTGRCIIARDHNWLYIADLSYGITYLYDLNAKGDSRYTNVASSHSDIAATMDEYVRAVVQAGWDIHNTPISSR